MTGCIGRRGPKTLLKPKPVDDWGRNTDPLEKVIEKTVKTYARSLGILVRKWSAPGQRGVPDDLFFFDNGVLLIIEFKRLGKKPTANQQAEIAKLIARGFHVRVVDSIPYGKELIKKWDKYAKSLSN